MAPTKPVRGKPAVAADFNAIIHADRQRRKNEALAAEIFNKGRRASAPGELKRPGQSLASRVGVQKRALPAQRQNGQIRREVVAQPAGNVDAEWTHDLHSLNNSAAPRAAQPARLPKVSNLRRNERLSSALSGSISSPNLNSQFKVVAAPNLTRSLSIRGIAGPYIVMAENFAFGTTAEDIIAAMSSDGSVINSARVISERPTVVAEIVLEEKQGADRVIKTFNNQHADGHLLRVYYKSNAPAPVVPTGPRAASRLNNGRQSTNVTDGTFGFDEPMDTDDQGTTETGLYSDRLVENRRGRGRYSGRGRGYK